MIRLITAAALVLSASGLLSQTPPSRPKFDAFEVAAIKQMEHDPKGGQFITMQGDHRAPLFCRFRSSLA